MLKLYMDGLLFHDVNSDARCRDISIDLEANSAGTLSFTMDEGNPLYAAFTDSTSGHEVWAVDGDGYELFRGRVTDSQDGDELECSVTCEGQLAYLNDSLVRPFATYQADDMADGTALIGSDPTSVVEYLLKNHNAYASSDEHIEMGECDLTGTILVYEDGYPTVSECLTDNVLDYLGAYATVRTEGGVRYLDVISSGNGRNGQLIEFGSNLMSYARERDTSDIYTAIVPTFKIGDEDEERTLAQVVSIGEYDGVEVDGTRALCPSAVARYGIREEYDTYEASTVEEAAQLLFADVRNKANIYDSVTIGAIDLHVIDPTVQAIHLLDWVEISAEPYGIDMWMMCAAVTMGEDPSATEYTFGTILPTLTKKAVRGERAYAAMGNGVREMQKLTEAQKQTASVAQSAESKAAEATEQAQAASDAAAEANDAADVAKSAADTATASAQAASDAASKAQTAVDTVSETVTGMQTELDTASANASKALTDSAAAVTASSEAKTAASNAETSATEASTKAASAETAASEAKTAAASAETNASNAVTTANAASDTAAAAKTESASALTKAEDALSGLETYKETVTATYATKGELTETSTTLTNSIESNAAQIKETMTKVTEVDETANNAKDLATQAGTAAAAAQTDATSALTNAATAQKAADEAASAASTAQSAADTAAAAAKTADEKAAAAQTDLDTAKQNLVNVTSRVDATEEDIAAAEKAVETAQAAADAADAAAAAAQSTADAAQSAADTAKANAATAQTAADNAQAAADAAQEAAEKAQSDTDALAVRVTTAETSITKNAEAIELAATKTEVTQTLGGYYTKEEADAAIKVSADEISSKVETNADNISTLTQTATSLQAQIGDRSGKSTTLTADVDGISSTVSTLNGDMSTVKQSVSDVTTTIKQTIVSQQTLMYRSASTTAPSKPTAAVTETGTAVNNTWTTGQLAYDSSYPYLYTCTQYKLQNGTYGWTSVESGTYSGYMSSVASTANTANSTANTAKTAAATAQSTADTKVGIGDSGISTLDTAMVMESDGLSIFQKVSGAIAGYISKMAAGAFQILTPSKTVVAQFTDSLIELGRNTTTATIKLCSGKAKINYGGNVSQFTSDDDEFCVCLGNNPYDGNLDSNSRTAIGVINHQYMKTNDTNFSVGEEGATTAFAVADYVYLATKNYGTYYKATMSNFMTALNKAGSVYSGTIVFSSSTWTSGTAFSWLSATSFGLPSAANNTNSAVYLMNGDLIGGERSYVFSSAFEADSATVRIQCHDQETFASTTPVLPLRINYIAVYFG